MKGQFVGPCPARRCPYGGTSTVKRFFYLLRCTCFTVLQKNIPGGESGSCKHESALRTRGIRKPPNCFGARSRFKAFSPFVTLKNCLKTEAGESRCAHLAGFAGGLFEIRPPPRKKISAYLR